MTTTLQELCAAFEKHCDECKQCSFMVLHELDADNRINMALMMQADEKPLLCNDGKNLLLNIFT